MKFGKEEVLVFVDQAKEWLMSLPGHYNIDWLFANQEVVVVMVVIILICTIIVTKNRHEMLNLKLETNKYLAENKRLGADIYQKEKDLREVQYFLKDREAQNRRLEELFYDTLARFRSEHREEDQDALVVAVKQATYHATKRVVRGSKVIAPRENKVAKNTVKLFMLLNIIFRRNGLRIIVHSSSMNNIYASLPSVVGDKLSLDGLFGYLRSKELHISLVEENASIYNKLEISLEKAFEGLDKLLFSRKDYEKIKQWARDENKKLIDADFIM